ncbi:MAG TPA: methionyl-tRNA formyltransferase [Parachlamydiaceae bacterium]|nr:methionyl-tRNA formyltransferase [Parachlamydiaceae bacterium]
MKIVYFGTPNFAAEALSFLLKHGVDVVAVVTKPDKAQGRSSKLIPTPVKCVAENFDPPIPVYQPETVSAAEYAPILEAYQADLFVVVAYGEIIKQHLLDMPKAGCINVHASLLPTYRGAAPIQRCIINGEKETGITIMHMARKMDAGDIISMEKVVIGQDMTYGELEAELCHVGSEMLLKTIRGFERGEVQRTVQDHSLATFAPKIEIEDCRIDWNRPAAEIHNLVRGVNPHPGAWCQVIVKGQNKRLRVIATKVVPELADVQPGQIVSSTKEGLFIGCGKGVINLIKVQLEGKKPMAAEELMRGLSVDALQFITQ